MDMSYPAPGGQGGTGAHISKETIEFHYGRSSGLRHKTNELMRTPKANRPRGDSEDSQARLQQSAQVWTKRLRTRQAEGRRPATGLSSRDQRELATTRVTRSSPRLRRLSSAPAGWIGQGRRQAEVINPRPRRRRSAARQADLTIDVWDTLILDYRNARPKYSRHVGLYEVDIRWEFANANL